MSLDITKVVAQVSSMISKLNLPETMVQIQFAKLMTKQSEKLMAMLESYELSLTG